MDITQWYAVALGGLVVLFHASYLIMKISCFLKHLFCPQVRFSTSGFNRYIGLSTMRVDVMLVVLFLVGNAICITVGVKDIASLVRRSALLCTINLMPLALGERMNPMASIFGVRLSASASMHEWLGSVVMAEGLVHIAAALSSQHIDVHNTSGIAKLVVSHLCFVTLSRANACEGCRCWRGPAVLFHGICTPTFL
jgi:hypothetical protein